MTKTMITMRSAWVSAIVRSSPPMALPINVIVASPPGVPAKYAVIGS